MASVFTYSHQDTIAALLQELFPTVGIHEVVANRDIVTDEIEYAAVLESTATRPIMAIKARGENYLDELVAKLRMLVP